MKLYILIILILIIYYFTTNKNKEHFTNKNGTIIFFYANWCGHCSEFKPVWNKLKKNEKNNYEFVEVESYDLEKDNYTNDTLIKNINKIKKNIQGFPTIVYIKNNNIYYIKNRNNIIEEIKHL